MSGDILHNIFYQFDGESCARRLKEFFSGRKYNVQFNLHELQNAYSTTPCNVGVSILLFTPHSHAFIVSQKHADLNAIFPNPELSAVLIFGVEKTKAEISTFLSSRITDFHKWKILEYRDGGSFNTLDKDIMMLVERSEGYLLSPSLQRFRVWNCERVKPDEGVLLIFTKPVENDPQVKVIQEWDSREQMAQRLNSMTYSFTVGESYSNYELPTLLHFGAKYGLRRFCMELLRHPGGIHAQKMKNKDGLRPDQIAQKERFDDLAMDLRTGMNETKNMETLQSPLRRIKGKAPIYVHTPQSPFGGEANVAKHTHSYHGVERNDTKNGPQPCTKYQTQPLKSPRSLPSYLQAVPEQSNVPGSQSVRSSSDSGLGEEIHIRSTVTETERPQPCTPSTRKDSNFAH